MTSLTQRREDTGEIDIARESGDTGTRTAAQRLRETVLARLREHQRPITLDFANVASTSSSFLDELLGRLAYQLGREAFR